MALSSNFSVRVANDLVHDVCAGLWPGTVLGVWLLHTGVERAAPQASFALVPLTVSSLWVLVVSLGLLVATGALRLRYWRLNVRAGALQAKARMALVKHTAFVGALAATTLYAFTLMRP